MTHETDGAAATEATATGAKVGTNKAQMGVVMTAMVMTAGAVSRAHGQTQDRVSRGPDTAETSEGANAATPGSTGAAKGKAAVIHATEVARDPRGAGATSKGGVPERETKLGITAESL